MYFFGYKVKICYTMQILPWLTEALKAPDGAFGCVLGLRSKCRVSVRGLGCLGFEFGFGVLFELSGIR